MIACIPLGVALGIDPAVAVCSRNASLHPRSPPELPDALQLEPCSDRLIDELAKLDAIKSYPAFVPVRS